MLIIISVLSVCQFSVVSLVIIRTVMGCVIFEYLLGITTSIFQVFLAPFNLQPSVYYLSINDVSTLFNCECLGAVNNLVLGVFIAVHILKQRPVMHMIFFTAACIYLINIKLANILDTCISFLFSSPFFLSSLYLYIRYNCSKFFFLLLKGHMCNRAVFFRMIIPHRRGMRCSLELHICVLSFTDYLFECI